MRALTIFLGSLILTLIVTRVAAKEVRRPAAARTYSCKVVKGHVTALGHGPSPQAAKDDARTACGAKLINQRFAQGGEINHDAEDELALACVNLECQK